ANFRAAKAVAVVQLMEGENSGTAFTGGYFNASTSEFDDAITSAYQAKAKDVSTETAHEKTQYIQATVDKDGKLTVAWVAKP
ncbi:MAG: hypothetical protein RR426_01785, partial [Oscillospiraceae bacterium]